MAEKLGWGLIGASTLLSPGPCNTPPTNNEVLRLTPPSITAIGGTSVVSDAALSLAGC